VIRRLLRDSISARAAVAIALVLGGYLALHARFATVDAAIAASALKLVGFHVSAGGPGDLVVHQGRDFSLYAVVTGSCSSAAGVLGLAAVALILLPGRVWRRWTGGLLAAGLFVVFNVARICSIVLIGWAMATVDHMIMLAIMSGLALVGLAVAGLPHRRILLRIAGLIAAGLCGVLAYKAGTGGSYLQSMIAYHALAGPVLTFGCLAMGIIVVWRLLVGPPRRVEAAASS